MNDVERMTDDEFAHGCYALGIAKGRLEAVVAILELVCDHPLVSTSRDAKLVASDVISKCRTISLSTDKLVGARA